VLLIPTLVIPQEPGLFSGTLRSNLDPFGLHEEASLWSAVQRSHLLSSTPEGVAGENSQDQGSGRFSLDTTIDVEGGNLSVGQVREPFFLLDGGSAHAYWMM